MACRAPKFFGKKEPIASKWWLVDIGNAFRSRLYLEETKVKLVSYLLKDKDLDLRKEVGHALGGKAVKAMAWDDFVMKFKLEFAPVIEV